MPCQPKQPQVQFGTLRSYSGKGPVAAVASVDLRRDLRLMAQPPTALPDQMPFDGVKALDQFMKRVQCHAER
jgi:hypothetical protein